MIFQRINFHDNKLPVFKENKAKGFVTFGADNLYPDFLVELFNKSPKHNAIVSAKASYIAGEQLLKDNPHMAIVYTGYAFSNVGLYLLAK